MDPIELVEVDAELLGEVCGFSTLAITPKKITPIQIEYIESKLPLYDHVAFAFLACSDPSQALERISSALALQKNKGHWQGAIISPWCKAEGQRSTPLIEILWLLQNWELLRMLGLGQSMVKLQELDPYRVALFRLIDKLDDAKLTKVMQSVGGEALTVEYAEVPFLQWLRDGRISPQNSTSLARAVREIGLEGEARLLEELEAKLPVTVKTIQNQDEPQEQHSVIMTPPVSINEPNYQVQQYVMNPQTAGLCLIFNQRNFLSQSLHLPDRLGTELDCQKLSWTFRMFGYDVQIFNDRTSSALLSDIRRYSQQNFSKYDSLVICILSHGIEGAVYGSDGREVKVRDLALSFASNRCPTLNQKPKLIFVQACQGGANQAPVHVEPYRDITTDGPESRPTVCDFFEAWATVPGFVSYRSKSQGSIFVRALCDVLQQVGHEQDLDHVMKLVLSKVSGQDHRTSAESSIYKQMPVYTSCLTKNLRFTRHQEFFIETVIERLEELFLECLINYFIHVTCTSRTTVGRAFLENN